MAGYACPTLRQALQELTTPDRAKPAESAGQFLLSPPALPNLARKSPSHRHRIHLRLIIAITTRPAFLMRKLDGITMLQ